MKTCCRTDVFALLGALATLGGCGSSAEPTGGTPPAVDPSAVEADSNLAQGATVIVAMGDSLTEGYNVEPTDSYPAQLERKLRLASHNVRVVNAGISGETSSGARARVDWVLTLKPDIVILETGGNDGLRGIDPELTARNIQHIVTFFKQHGVIVVLAGMQIVQNMGQEYVDGFRAIYPEAAARHNVTLIPFFLEGVAGIAGLNQADGIHPTAEGYAIVVDTIFPYIDQTLRESVADRSADNIADG